MKFRAVTFSFALLVAACFTGIVHAQIRVNIPFSFSTGTQTLPPGHYTVAPVDERNPIAWRLTNDNRTVMFLTNSVESASTSHPTSLIFIYAQDQYYLAQIWPAEHSGKDLLLKPKVTTMILAKGAKYVQIEAE